MLNFKAFTFLFKAINAACPLVMFPPELVSSLRLRLRNVVVLVPPPPPPAFCLGPTVVTPPSFFSSAKIWRLRLLELCYQTYYFAFAVVLAKQSFDSPTLTVILYDCFF
jgi:hypothetical protein